MRVPMFLWKHIPHVKIFEHHLYRCGNTCLTHTSLQYFFLTFCVTTQTYLLVLEVKNLETDAPFRVFSIHNRKQTRVPRQPFSFLSFSLPQQETPGFETLHCCHASREIVPRLSRKIVLPYKISVAKPKKIIPNFSEFFFGCICYLMLYFIIR